MPVSVKDLEAERLIQAVARKTGEILAWPVQPTRLSRLNSPRRMAASSLSLALVVLTAVFLAVLLPPQQILLRTLETRFPPWRDFNAKDIAGIVIVGGALNFDLTRWSPETELTDAARRVTATAELAKQFPQAKIIYSGGGGAPSEAELGKAILVRLGVKPNRIMVETGSRSTAENAKYSRELVQIEGRDRWILVTSAFHMPRAVGAFRAAGFPVEAYPVDYRADSSSDFFKNLSSLQLALREYLALGVYRLTGWTQELFPAS